MRTLIEAQIEQIEKDLEHLKLIHRVTGFQQGVMDTLNEQLVKWKMVLKELLEESK